MTRSIGFIVLVLALVLEPFVKAGPLWNKESPEAQGVKNALKKIGSILCKATNDDSNPNALTEAIQTLGKMDQAEIESVEEILKKFGSSLCDYVTDSSGSLEKLTTQVLTSPPFVPQLDTRFLPQKLTSVEAQGRLSNVLGKIGSALCRAAYNKDNPNALAKAFPEMNKVEIQGVKNFLKRFGSNLCDYIPNENEGQSELTFKAQVDSTNGVSWSAQKLSKAEMQGFLNLATKVGTALCKAAFEGQNPRAIAESLGITDEVDTQKFTDFLERFGSNLCDYVTGSGDKKTKQRVASRRARPRETFAKEEGFVRKIGSALCRAAYNNNPRVAAQLMGATNEVEVQKFTDFLNRFGSNLCDYVTDDSQRNVNRRPTYVELQWSNAQKQRFLNTARKVGSALCKAAYNPTMLAKSAVSQGVMNQAEAQKFKTFLKRFGANLCDYITQDPGNGSFKALEQDLVQELEAAAK